MIFSKPVDFQEALASRVVKRALPTTLGSADLAKIAPALRERAMFSARTTNAGYLQEINDLVSELINGKADQATIRLKLKQTDFQLSYQPDVADRGGLKDLSSDARLNLIIGLNAKMAQGYGFWQQSQDTDLLFAYPAQELYRAEDREAPRNWQGRWQDAGGEFYQGRMIAPKNDPIWAEISAFGLPYPPFDYNSGMDVRDVSRKEAVELGVIDEGEEIEPQSRDFNEGLQVSAEQFDQSILDSLGKDFKIEGGVLKPASEIAVPQPPVKPKPPVTPPPPVPPAKPKVKAPEPTPAPVVRAKVEAPVAAPPVQKTSAASPIKAPVSNALQIERRANAQPLLHTKRLVDSVHDDGVLPKLPIDGNPPRDAGGVYVSSKSTGAARRIGVRNVDGQVHSFTHEIGHFIDHHGLDKPGQFASETSPLLEDWRNVVKESKAVKALLAKLQSATSQKARQFYSYQSEGGEIFARSYAQYIAEKSGDPIALKELAMRLNSPYGSQWTTEDFAPIKAALDRLFRLKGWIP